jgi:hypothetical protein
MFVTLQIGISPSPYLQDEILETRGDYNWYDPFSGIYTGRMIALDIIVKTRDHIG